VSPVDQSLREPASVHEIARQNEQRYLHQCGKADVRHHRLRNHDGVDRLAGLRLDAEPAGEDHGPADVYADQDQQNERDEQQNENVRHEVTAPQVPPA
jgi:hypothetical protein